MGISDMDGSPLCVSVGGEPRRRGSTRFPHAVASVAHQPLGCLSVLVGALKRGAVPSAQQVQAHGADVAVRRGVVLAEAAQLLVDRAQVHAEPGRELGVGAGG